MVFGIRFPSARITLILLIVLTICLDGVLASGLVPGIKNWDSIKVWQNSSLRNVWELVEEYIDFRSYAFTKLSDMGYLDHLLDELGNTKVQNLFGYGAKTGIVVSLVADAAGNVRRRLTRQSNSQEEASDETDSEVVKDGLSMKEILDRAKSLILRMLRSGHLKRLANLHGNILHFFVYADRKFFPKREQQVRAAIKAIGQWTYDASSTFDENTIDLDDLYAALGELDEDKLPDYRHRYETLKSECTDAFPDSRHDFSSLEQISGLAHKNKTLDEPAWFNICEELSQRFDNYSQKGSRTQAFMAHRFGRTRSADNAEAMQPFRLGQASTTNSTSTTNPTSTTNSTSASAKKKVHFSKAGATTTRVVCAEKFYSRRLSKWLVCNTILEDGKACTKPHGGEPKGNFAKLFDDVGVDPESASDCESAELDISSGSFSECGSNCTHSTNVRPGEDAAAPPMVSKTAQAFVGHTGLPFARVLDCNIVDGALFMLMMMLLLGAVMSTWTGIATPVGHIAMLAVVYEAGVGTVGANDVRARDVVIVLLMSLFLERLYTGWCSSKRAISPPTRKLSEKQAPVKTKQRTTRKVLLVHRTDSKDHEGDLMLKGLRVCCRCMTPTEELMNCAIYRTTEHPRNRVYFACSQANPCQRSSVGCGVVETVAAVQLRLHKYALPDYSRMAGQLNSLTSPGQVETTSAVADEDAGSSVDEAARHVHVRPSTSIRASTVSALIFVLNFVGVRSQEHASPSISTMAETAPLGPVGATWYWLFAFATIAVPVLIFRRDVWIAKMKEISAPVGAGFHTALNGAMDVVAWWLSTCVCSGWVYKSPVRGRSAMPVMVRCRAPVLVPGGFCRCHEPQLLIEQPSATGYRCDISVQDRVPPGALSWRMAALSRALCLRTALSESKFATTAVAVYASMVRMLSWTRYVTAQLAGQCSVVTVMLILLNAMIVASWSTSFSALSLVPHFTDTAAMLWLATLMGLTLLFRRVRSGSMRGMLAVVGLGILLAPCAVSFSASASSVDMATKIWDCGASRHFVSGSKWLHTLKHRRVGFATGVGATPTSGGGDGSLRVATDNGGFSDPYPVVNAVVAHKLPMELYGEGPFEDSNVFRDTRNRKIYQVDPATGREYNFAPLRRADSGSLENLYPIQGIMVDIDGSPFDHDNSTMANKLRRFLADPGISQASSGSNNSGSVPHARLAFPLSTGAGAPVFNLPTGPAELQHSRWSCPGKPAAAALGWDQGHMVCDTCVQGKMTKADVNRTPVPKIPVVGAQVNGDILGPFEPTIRQKYRYCAFFVDVWSKTIFTYPMKHKNEFYDAFTHVAAKFKANGTPVTKFRTDTDSIMSSGRFHKQANELGIVVDHSSPYCQWQNGPCERRWRDAKNRTICNLIRSGLGPKWWWPALRHGVDSLNATPSEGNPAGVSPRMIWKGLVRHDDGEWHATGSIDETFRRAFGAHAWVRRPNRRQFEPRADKCTFLGYAPDHADGVYDFWNPRTRSQITSRDVVFDERNVTDRAVHEFIVTEGTRTLPSWIGDNPFTPEGSCDATGPYDDGKAVSVGEVGEMRMLEVTQPGDSSQDAILPATDTMVLPVKTGEMAGDVTAPVHSVLKRTWTKMPELGRFKYDKWYNTRGVLRMGVNTPRAGYIRERVSLISDKGWSSQQAIGQLVPSKSGVSAPYKLRDLKYDCKHRFLTHVALTQSGAEPHTAVAAAALNVGWYEHHDGAYVDTVRTTGAETMLTRSQCDVVAGLRDVDTDATIVVHNEFESAMGTVSGATWYIRDQTCAPEPSLFGPTAFHADPKNYKDAMQRSDREAWRRAYLAEVNSISKSGCWGFVTKPPNVKPGRIIVVWKIKHNADGTVDRYKVRMCFDGSSQSDDIETFQHVAEMDTFKVFCAAATQHNEIIMQTDVDNAFLHGELTQPVYAHAPQGMRAPRNKDGDSKVLKITGNLYGNRESPRVYGRLFDKHLQGLPTHSRDGNLTTLIRGRADHSTWHVRRVCSTTGTVTRCDILVYVDDNLFKFPSTEAGWQLYRDICTHINERLPLKKHDGEFGEPARSFLGCNISRDLEAGFTTISTPGKIDAAVSAMGMQNCNPRPQVGEVKNILRTRASTEEDACIDPKLYRSVIGTLMWVARFTRPDIMQRTAELARFNHDPGVSHWQALKYLVAYVKGTRGVCIRFSRRDDVAAGTLPFSGFMDADYAPNYGCEFSNHKSTTGYIFTVCGVAFSWRSSKQPIIADSTSAAEFIAVTEASKQAVWLKRLFSDLGYDTHAPVALYEDNEACEKLIRNYCGHDRLKHLDIRLSLIREHHDKQLICVKRVKSNDQLADMFTKVMPAAQQTRLRKWATLGEVPVDCSLRSDLDGSSPLL